jgi:uncharacterized protein YecA (UPF0149 family)
LRQKTTITYGGEGLPVDELPVLGTALRQLPSKVRAGRKVGRNERCPCGSGKKFKKCCG